MPPPTGELVAWDPVAQKAAWRAKYPVVEGGGVLATGGNLVFQGRADGIFAAYRATDGKQLWPFDAGTGIMAPPVTYTVDGDAVCDGDGGMGRSQRIVQRSGAGQVKPGYGRILTFALGGTGTLKAPSYGHKEPPTPAITMNAPKRRCIAGSCFSTSLRRLPWHQCSGGAEARSALREQGSARQFEEIVLGGARASPGMPSFAKILKPDQVHAIEAYIVSRAAEKN